MNDLGSTRQAVTFCPTHNPVGTTAKGLVLEQPNTVEHELLLWIVYHLALACFALYSVHSHVYVYTYIQGNFAI